jgi:hypothetical protein
MYQQQNDERCLILIPGIRREQPSFINENLLVWKEPTFSMRRLYELRKNTDGKTGYKGKTTDILKFMVGKGLLYRIQRKTPIKELPHKYRR